MRDVKVSVEKLTDESLMRKACECTFIGTSMQSLLSMYKAEHSPARTQMFWVKLENIDLFIATHLLRHHVGSVPFQLTCRDDRNGGNQNVPEKCNKIVDLVLRLSNVLGMEGEERMTIIDEIKGIAEDLKENSDRHTPVNLGLLINAQSLIDMAKLRLCTGNAHPDTVKVFLMIKAEIAKVDKSLASMMVRKCVYRGGICGERCCGFNNTVQFSEELGNYLMNFNSKQCGRYLPVL